MYQKFGIVSIDPILADKKVIITLSLDVDAATVTKESVCLAERDTSTMLDYDLVVSKKTITLELREWPVPNTEYLLMVQRGVMSVSEEELDAGIRRKIFFPSGIASVVTIVTPSNNEKINSVDLAWEEHVAEPDKGPVSSYYLEISSDNAFYNLVKTTKVIGRQTISLTDVPTGQFFLRVRVQDGDQYGRWSETISFLFNGGTVTAKTFAMAVAMDASPITVVEMGVTKAPDNGITPTVLHFEMSSDVDPASVTGVVLRQAGSATNLDIDVVVTGNAIDITPKTALEDNSTYQITIGSARSVDGKEELTDYTTSIVTAMSPMYATVDDVNSVIGEFEVPEAQILYYIHDASMFVDWTNKGTAQTAPYSYQVVQFVKYKAARDALLKAYMLRAAASGTKGSLGDISYEYSNSTPGIKDLLKDLQAEIQYWLDAVRGYGPEGRQRPRSTQRGLKSTPQSNAIQTFSGGDYSRGQPMGGGI